MTLNLDRSRPMLDLVDIERGTVSRKLFSDQDLYQLELERIFARAWNFVAHDSQIPNPGDFFMTFIGEDRVIVVRDNDMLPQVLVNSCRHRGNAVCRAEEGHSSSFMCTYHGWTYDLKGNLVGVPGFKEVYHEELDRENWGLIRAAKVETYKGFIFANMDANAPDLDDYLGNVGRTGISLMAERGEMKVAPGIQKYTIPCNWKFAADNVWDFYHPGISHASQQMAGWSKVRQPLTQTLTRPQQVLLGEYGHVVSGAKSTDAQRELTRNSTGVDDDSWRETESAKEALGPIGIMQGGHPHIFPNLWFTTNQMSLRIPKGPQSTEIWWFSILDVNAPQDLYSERLHRRIHNFGPAGMLEQDDGENWGESTRGANGVVSRRFPLNYSMSIHRGDVIDDEYQLPRVETPNVNEHAQLWYYRSWAEWMAAESWDDLRAIHSIPEGNV
jgi:phenylpropionate dioxygenase-like ring-hydroxylating dioxygenase large terminal subunit